MSDKNSNFQKGVQMKYSQYGLIILGAFLAVGLAVSGYFVGQTMYNAKVAINTAFVKGLAERRVEADTANWLLRYTVMGKNKSEQAGMYEEAEKIKNKIIEILKKDGFADTEIKPGVIHYSHKEYRDRQQNIVDQKYILVGDINIESKNVRLVEKERTKINSLIAQGYDITNYAPTYLFTKLNEIKPEMLKEATKNARLAANEFAKNAGVEVGRIRNARQGGFSIRDVGSEYEDTEKIEKMVRVVTSIEFYLTDGK